MKLTIQGEVDGIRSTGRLSARYTDRIKNLTHIPVEEIRTAENRQAWQSLITTTL